MFDVCRVLFTNKKYRIISHYQQGGFDGLLAYIRALL